MDNLISHLKQQIAEWPQQQMQALEIVLNSPFVNNRDALLYKSRTLYELNQVRLHHCPTPLHLHLRYPAWHPTAVDAISEPGITLLFLFLQLHEGTVGCCDHRGVKVQTAVSVGNGGEAWIGYKQDLRPCRFGLMMSIEPSFSVFYEGLSVVDYTQAVLTKNPRNPWEWTNDFLTPPEQKEISKELKGVVVRAPCCTLALACACARISACRMHAGAATRR